MLRDGQNGLSQPLLHTLRRSNRALRASAVIIRLHVTYTIFCRKNGLCVRLQVSFGCHNELTGKASSHLAVVKTEYLSLQQALRWSKRTRTHFAVVKADSPSLLRALLWSEWTLYASHRLCGGQNGVSLPSKGTLRASAHLLHTLRLSKRTF